VSGYLRPGSLEEALSARRAHPDWMVLAGGTDLLVAAHRQVEPPGVLDLFGLGPLSRIEERDDGSVVVGAAVPYAAILASELVRREIPILAEAAREIGALQIQARGTVGGNVATSSPVGDTLPVLLALDALVEVASVDRRREVAYSDFLTGYRKTRLEADELLVAIRFPPRSPGLVQAWRKVGTRRAQSISKVMMAAAARVERGAIAEVRIALGAVADRPIRALATERALLGQAPGPEAAERARQVLAGEITPIDDVRSTAAYRLRVAQNLVARFVESLDRE
jgi:xanthine dehydrogenase small subunit